MSKISEETASAFMSGRKYSNDNTEVILGTSYIGLFLHGTKIAERNGLDPEFFVSFNGYPTQTTKSRLNALPGVRAWTARGIHYINGSEVRPYEWVRVEIKS